MPSVYHSCTVDDAAMEAVARFRQDVESIRKSVNDQVAAMQPYIDQLTGTPTNASLTVGPTVDSQITWTAVASGMRGNEIAITYLYLGPDTVGGVLVARPASSYTVDEFIYCVLPCDAAGAVSQNAATCLTTWMTDPDVAALVTSTLVGTGLDDPEAVATTFLSGGKSAPVTAAESAANDIAKVFGHVSYKALMQATGIPYLDTTEDAETYLEESGDYITINGNLLIVEGTNLVGINKLYEVLGDDLVDTLNIIDGMTEKRPTLITTQNLSSTTYIDVCGETQPLVTITETYRAMNENIYTTAAKYAVGDLTQFNYYIFWGVEPDPSMANHQLLHSWGIPDEYIGDIFQGTTPEADDFLDVDPPAVYTVEDLELLDDLQFTDAELELLLAKKVGGVRIPHLVPVEDRTKALRGLLKARPLVQANGMHCSAKAAVAALQAVDVGKVAGDSDLAKELTTRGKACARLQAQLDGFNASGLPTDLANIPFDQLPDPAKKAESAYAALSSAIDFANKMFDLSINTIVDSVSSVLNKIQNLLSLTDNILDNDLANCLLGTGTDKTGFPEYTPPGMGGGSSIPSLDSLTGGLPIPMSLLADAFKEMSISLDTAITDAFVTLMKTIQLPLCMVNTLISTISGISLGGLLDALNPCKEGKDTEDSCPPEDVQAIIDASTEMTATLSTIPSLVNEATTKPVETITEEIENFTGWVKKVGTSTTETVTRGVTQVLGDMTKSVESKISVVDDFDKAIRDIFGEAREVKVDIDEKVEGVDGCAMPSLGLLKDEIFDYL